MALVLVQHDISKQIVEIDEIHLAHPILGPHYKRVRVNENGKVFALNPTDADEESDADISEIDTTVQPGETVLSADDVADIGKAKLAEVKGEK